MTRGLTLVELLIVLAILSILAVLAFGSLQTFSDTQALLTGSNAAVSLIERAQNEALAGAGGVPHGVHIASTTLTLFSGTVYDPGGSTNEAVALTGGVVIAHASLAGGGLDIVFDQLTGATEELGSLVLEAGGNSTRQKTIQVSPTGVVSVQ